MQGFTVSTVCFLLTVKQPTQIFEDILPNKKVITTMSLDKIESLSRPSTLLLDIEVYEQPAWLISQTEKYISPNFNSYFFN